MEEIRKLSMEKLMKKAQNMEKSNAMWNKRAKGFKTNPNKESKDRYMEFIKRYVDIKGKSIIDLGSGAGRYLKLLLDEGAHVEGLEPSIEMVKQSKIYLEECGYKEKEVLIYHQAFQAYQEEKQYDYVFVSHSPVISYYENYEKMLKLAKKGIFISAWFKMKDEILLKLAKTLKREVHDHSSMDLLYLFNLFVADGYFPNIEMVEIKNQGLVRAEDVYGRYTSWLYGHDFTEGNMDKVKKALESVADREGNIPMASSQIKAMMYVDIEKKH